jgi:hypothetical protein
MWGQLRASLAMSSGRCYDLWCWGSGEAGASYPRQAIRPPVVPYIRDMEPATNTTSVACPGARRTLPGKATAYSGPTLNIHARTPYRPGRLGRQIHVSGAILDFEEPRPLVAHVPKY